MSEPRQLFPLMLDLAGRRCLVVGAGEVGEGKIRGLLASGAAVSVVALAATSQVQEWTRSGAVEYRQKAFAPEDLEGALLVVAATSAPEVNRRVYAEARRRRVLCNVVDDPEHCDFFYPAIVRRGALQIAISTSGVSPAFARRLRQVLEAQFGPEYADWLDALARRRQEILRTVADPAQRRLLLEELAANSPLSRRKPEK
jgi:precorrin-2 dehydrogenase/sirohydrochlorin ferrochelatase